MFPSCPSAVYCVLKSHIWLSLCSYHLTLFPAHIKDLPLWHRNTTLHHPSTSSYGCHVIWYCTAQTCIQFWLYCMESINIRKLLKKIVWYCFIPPEQHHIMSMDNLVMVHLHICLRYSTKYHCDSGKTRDWKCSSSRGDNLIWFLDHSDSEICIWMR